jgi:hypothetical protein
MIVKSNPKEKQEDNDLLDQLSVYGKVNAIAAKLFKLIQSLLEVQKQQKALESSKDVSVDNLCDKIDELISAWIKNENQDAKIGTSVADAIKEIKFPQVPKVDLSPLNSLAQSIQSQNKSLQDLIAKISQPTPQAKQDNSGYESLVRESLSAINKNNEALRMLAESLKKEEKQDVKEEKKPVSYVSKVTYNQFGSIQEITHKPIQ